MKNQVIEVLDIEHGKKVIEYWKSKGFDVRGFVGNQTREDDSEFRFYGVINGEFNNYYQESIDLYEAEIIELPTESPKEENTFPRVMLVSDDGDFWYKRVVLMQKCDRFLTWNNAETIEESECVFGILPWRYAKEVEPKQRTITLSDLNSNIEDIKKLFGIGENDDVIIKLD